MIRKPRAAVMRAAAVIALAGLVGGAVATSAGASPISFTATYGVDRYMTSAFADGDPTHTAYLVSGEAFPDGLAAGAVAGQSSGNVYLTERNVIPQSVRERLIYARKIVVVGGENAVGPDVMTWLQQNTRAALSRVSGPDRYDTAAAVSASYFATPVAGKSGAPNVVVATGADWPDALAGSAAAAEATSPLLLVPGTSIPASVAAELTRLKPAAITVVGGAGRVSDGVLDQLRSFTAGPVVRVAGADRYDTAVRLSSTFFSSADHIVVASGDTFADALAAGARAGRNGGPLLLVGRTCVTEGTNLEIERLQRSFSGDEAALESYGGLDRINGEAQKRTNCQPAGTAPKTYLENLPYVEGSARYRVDHATIGGHFYPRSTAFDTDPRNSDYASWTLGGKYGRFTATVGVADGNTSGLSSTVQVFGDEKLLATAPVTVGQPVNLSVDVRGISRLKIVTTSPNAAATPADPEANYVYIGDGAVS
ncbi:cell wall-binding repeat-containing protein [Kineococcus sp. NPDC059986]|uniref:cell wall-binding repeat-containing protein n=1 Tax=Kineococcus sp. NPDC059986 TaxID=3155538 RepID=UPI003450FCD6